MKTSELRVDMLYARRKGDYMSQLIMLLDTRRWAYHPLGEQVIRPAHEGEKQVKHAIVTGLPALTVAPFPSAGVAPVVELAQAARMFRAQVASEGGYAWKRSQDVHTFDTSAGTVRIYPVLVKPQEIVSTWEQNRARFAERDTAQDRHAAEVDQLREREAIRRAEVDADMAQARELLAEAARLHPGRFELGQIAPNSRTVKLELDDLLTLLGHWKDLRTERAATEAALIEAGVYARTAAGGVRDLGNLLAGMTEARDEALAELEKAKGEDSI
jgi:hypothetical protein